jgi:CYTH domain-containing protein
MEKSQIDEELQVFGTDNQYEALWKATAGRRLAKTRYTLPREGMTVEIDMYQGSLAGLAVNHDRGMTQNLAHGRDVGVPHIGTHGPDLATEWHRNGY